MNHFSRFLASSVKYPSGKAFKKACFLHKPSPQLRENGPSQLVGAELRAEIVYEYFHEEL